MSQFPASYLQKDQNKTLQRKFVAIVMLVPGTICSIQNQIDIILEKVVRSLCHKTWVQRKNPLTRVLLDVNLGYH